MENRKVPALIALAGVVVAVVLFLVLKDDTADEDTERPATAPSGQQAAPPAGDDGESKPEKEKQEKPPEPEIAVIEVENGEPVGGAQDLQFSRGEKIEFEVRTDTADELHLHGYDQYYDIAPGKPTEVSLDATIEGIFELESHTTGALFAEITVNPS